MTMDSLFNNVENAISQYEQAYARAFALAAKKADSNWDYGKPVALHHLQHILLLRQPFQSLHLMESHT